MADREVLEQILLQMKNMDRRLDQMDQRLGRLESDVAEIKETTAKNYDKTLEFYAAQKEANTASSEKLEQLSARVLVFENQAIANTAAIQKYIR